MPKHAVKILCIFSSVTARIFTGIRHFVSLVSGVEPSQGAARTSEALRAGEEKAPAQLRDDHWSTAVLDDLPKMRTGAVIMRCQVSSAMRPCAHAKCALRAFEVKGWKRDFCTDSYSTDTHIHMWQTLFSKHHGAAHTVSARASTRATK